jgi:hypothetical protein
MQQLKHSLDCVKDQLTKADADESLSSVRGAGDSNHEPIERVRKLSGEVIGRLNRYHRQSSTSSTGEST